jgi:hypothetical protein
MSSRLEQNDFVIAANGFAPEIAVKSVHGFASGDMRKITGGPALASAR